MGRQRSNSFTASKGSIERNDAQAAVLSVLKLNSEKNTVCEEEPSSSEPLPPATEELFVNSQEDCIMLSFASEGATDSESKSDEEFVIHIDTETLLSTPSNKSSWINNNDDLDITDEESAQKNCSENGMFDQFWSNWFHGDEEEASAGGIMTLNIDANDLNEWTKFAGESLSGIHVNQSPQDIESIILKCLDLPRPILQDIFVQYLLEDGMIEFFISNITRICSIKKREQSPTGVEFVVKICQDDSDSNFIDQKLLIERDTSDIVQGKRAYNATNILCEKCPSLQLLMSKGLERIISSLMRIFESGSNGSFKHFRKCYIELIQKSDFVVNFVLNERSPLTGRPYIIEMLRFLHEPCVMDCIILTLFPFTEINQSTRKAWYESLLISDFIPTLLCLLENKNPQCITEGAADLISRTLLESRNYEHSSIMFISFISDCNSQRKAKEGILGRLFEIYSSKLVDTEKMRSFIEALHSLFLKSQTPNLLPATVFPNQVEIHPSLIYTKEAAQALPHESNYLSILKHAIKNILLVNISPFCELFYKHDKKNNQIPGIPTSSMCQIVEIMHELIRFISICEKKSSTYKLPTNNKYPSDSELRGSYENLSSRRKSSDNGLPGRRLSGESFRSRRGSHKEEPAVKNEAEVFFKNAPLHILIDWFFDVYRDNSIYASAIYKTVLILIQNRKKYWILAVKSLLFGEKSKRFEGLVTRLVDAYKHEKYGNRGHIVLLMQLIREAAEEDEAEIEMETISEEPEDLSKSPLVQLLSKHVLWNSILDNLKEESQELKKGLLPRSVSPEVVSQIVEEGDINKN